MFKIVHKWRDSLIWCPSQCSYMFQYNDIEYEIYLRWRWNDPWTLSIMVDDRHIIDNWREIGTFPYFKQEDNLNVIKKHALIETIKYLKKWLN